MGWGKAAPVGKGNIREKGQLCAGGSARKPGAAWGTSTATTASRAVLNPGISLGSWFSVQIKTREMDRAEKGRSGEDRERE